MSVTERRDHTECICVLINDNNAIPHPTFVIKLFQ